MNDHAASEGAEGVTYVLVVEDDPDIREALSEALRGAGYAAAEAANGLEALDYLATHPDPCMILLDLWMPVLDGVGFLERLATHRAASVPVVLVSAAQRDEYETIATQKNIRGFLKKPVRMQTLLAVIAEHCGSPVNT